MTPKSHFQELDESTVFAWIEQIRRCSVSKIEREIAEAALYKCLVPVSTWFACLQTSPAGYDSEQVVNDSICQFMLVYVRNQGFEFHSCGHLVRILGKITTNQRRMSYRWNNKAKRTPHDLDGHTLPIKSLDIRACTCQSTSEDPACMCEHRDEVEHFSQLLSEDAHRQVLQLLLADFTWSEIGDKLDVNPKTVRLWVAQMRRVLNPQPSHLNPHTSHLNPQPSTLNPHTQHSTLNTQHSTLNTQHSTLNTQHSTLNTQHSTR